MPFFFEITTIIILGLALGSFASALIYRVPRGITWAFDIKTKQSRCPSCNKPLRIIDLIPLLSWLLSRGHCRQCGAAVSLLYPISELTLLVSSLGVYNMLGFDLIPLLFIFTLPFLWALFVIDLRHKILPNQLVAIVGGLGLLYCGLQSYDSYIFLGFDGAMRTAFSHFAGAGFFALVSWLMGWIVTKILKKEALGFGDVKFFAVAGLWLGLGALPMFMMLGGVLGVVLALFWRLRFKDDIFPFGPALIVAFYALMLVKGSLI